MNELDLSWTPRWLSGSLLEEVRGSLGNDAAARPVRFQRPRKGAWGAVRRDLESAGEVLRSMKIGEIVEGLGATAARWVDRSWPGRPPADALIAEATGFSREAVASSIEAELQHFVAPELWAALHREFGDPRVLDELRPVPSLKGWTRAFGPRSTIAVLTGNVPGLPVQAIARSLLVKSPIVIKVASGEPSFASAFARSLHHVDPRLASAIVVTYWGRDDREILAEAIAPFDTVVVYGGDDVCRTVRSLISPKQQYIDHGHKVSVGILSRKYLSAAGVTQVAKAVARDMSMYNQHACIAPQAYLVEGDVPEVRAFGEALAAACQEFAVTCPLGALPWRDAAAHALRRADLAWRAATDSLPLWYARSGDWSIVVAKDFGGDTSAGNRVLRLIPVHGIDDAITRIEPLASYLQNVGLGAMREDLVPAAERLGALGVSRVSEPGRMADPTLVWRHDGRPCIAELVRWCDVEMHEQMGSEHGGVHDER